MPSRDASTRRLRRSDLTACAPAVALGLLSFAFGTLPSELSIAGLGVPGGASAAGAIGLHLILLAAALFAAPAWRQPLALGRRGRFLLLALWVGAAAAAWASPVPRAGRAAVALLPAWLLVPAAVARCWPGPRERRRGLAAIAAVVLAVAAVALVDRLSAGSPRAAMPLGHHNLLAVWLLALLPLAALRARSPGPGRWVAVAATLLGGLALIASGSLSGALGAMAVLVAVALCGASRSGEEMRRRRPWLALAAGLAAIVALGLAAPRLAVVASGGDASVAVRTTYYRAGWEAFLARPLLGWGPGATPWTIAEWFDPVPGLSPAHEVVGDLHSLPLQILYELGLSGLLFVIAVTLLFPWRRLVALPVAVDRPAVLAGLLGLLGAGVALLSAAPLAVAAVPAALAVAAGAALAGEAPERLPLRRPRTGGDLLVVLYLAAVVFLVVPIDRAHLAYDRSFRHPLPSAEQSRLAEAVRHDPEFPLYRAQLARLAPTGPSAGGGAAAEALAAAEAAWGVAALWLAAGEAALEAGEPWAAIALERACHLDPFAAQAPYLLALAAPGAPEAPERAARALAAEPRLAAALAWRRLPPLREAALEELAGWEGIEVSWRRAFATAAEAAWRESSADAGIARLGLVVDRAEAGSLALHAFRRRPRPLGLVTVEVDEGAVRQLDLPPATTLAGTSPQVFGDRGCRVEGRSPDS